MISGTPLRKTLIGTAVDLPTICSLLGHSSIMMTSKYITQITDAQKRAVDSLVDAGELERRKDENPGGENSEDDRKPAYIQ